MVWYILSRYSREIEPQKWNQSGLHVRQAMIHADTIFVDDLENRIVRQFFGSSGQDPVNRACDVLDMAHSIRTKRWDHRAATRRIYVSDMRSR